jgi:hypothetical protein
VSRFTSRFVATALASGALLAAAALPASAADHHQRFPQRSSVVLGAIQYDSPGPENRSVRSLDEEWVTVANTGRHAVDLAGWTLSSSDRHTYRFGHLRLAAHASVRVHTGVGRDTARDVYQDRRDYVWDNHADTATLRDNRGHVVDTESWGHRGDDRGHGRADDHGHGRGDDHGQGRGDDHGQGRGDDHGHRGHR